MKTSTVYIFLLLTATNLFGQKDTSISSELNVEKVITTFSWKPFTIEINSSSLGHGMALEKNLSKKLFMRTSFSSDLKNYGDDGLAYKLGLATYYNLIEYSKITFKTGLGIGIRQIPTDACLRWSTGDCSPVLPMITVFTEAPILMQISFLENFSVDLGLLTLFQRKSKFLSELFYPVGFQNHLTASKNLVFAYHLALRYTITK